VGFHSDKGHHRRLDGARIDLAQARAVFLTPTRLDLDQPQDDIGIAPAGSAQGAELVGGSAREAKAAELGVYGSAGCCTWRSTGGGSEEVDPNSEHTRNKDRRDKESCVERIVQPMFTTGGHGKRPPMSGVPGT
jgi:hypothetical protein